MDTQNTPVHVRLWNKRFWTLAVANLLFSVASYMLIPVIPSQMEAKGYSLGHVAVVMGVFVVGMFLFGGNLSYLVQKHRRKNVFMLSTFFLVIVTGAFYYLGTLPGTPSDFVLFVVLRLLQAGFYGLSQLVLLSTLVIDTVEAVHRTEANHAATWFGRFAFSLGPLAGLLVCQHLNSGSVFLLSCVCGLSSLLLVGFVNFPFRSPGEDLCRFSFDRFLLKGSHWLFFNLVLVTAALGLLLSVESSPRFYGMVMVGFFLAILAERFAFADADLRSEVVTGLFSIGIAVLLMITRSQPSIAYITPVLTGLGVGVIGSRFLLFFIKLSCHCQRGTGQSTFLLAWETGLGMGLAAGYGIFGCNRGQVLWTCLAFLGSALLLYVLFVHGWYVRHKNR